MDSATEEESQRRLRRVRKKLRQIEHLKTLDRILNGEEELKVASEDSLRQEVCHILATMKRKVASFDDDDVERDHDQASLSETKKRRHSGDGDGGHRPTPAHLPAELGSEKELEVSRKKIRSDAASKQVDSEGSSVDDDDEEASEQVVRVAVTDSSQRHYGSFLRRFTSRSVVQVAASEGHEDLAFCCHIDGRRDLALTGGRDTSVLCWKVSSGVQLCSLRGHTGAVTAVSILPKGDGKPNEGISGSVDCSFKVWDLDKGVMMRNVYTFNGIRSMTCTDSLVITGSDGGKVEVFDILSGRSLLAMNAHEEAVTAMSSSIRDNDMFLLASGTDDGEIKVWELDPKAQGALRCLYSSEKGLRRRVQSVALLGDGRDLVAYCNGGSCVKVLDWKRRLTYKLRNHSSSHCITDCVTYEAPLLLASSFDLDSGIGSINMFKKGEDTSDRINLPEYLCTWCDNSAGRFLSLAADAKNTNNLELVTCGRDTRFWSGFDTSETRTWGDDNNVTVIMPTVLADLPGPRPEGSNSEDSEETSGEDSEIDNELEKPKQDVSTSNSSWRCQIL